MRSTTIAAAAALILVCAASTAFAQAQVTIRNGRVTIVARDATVRQILAEWARVGQTRIVNAERIPGGPLTLQLTDVPEEQALDLLLRNVSGYMAARRPTASGTLSRYDRILVMPTAAPVRQALAAGTPVLQQQQFVPVQPNDDNADDDRPVTTVVTPPRGPIFTTFQQAPGAPPAATPGNGRQAPAPGQATFVPQSPTADQPPAQPPASTPAPAAIGTSRPGMVIPPPVQQPGQTQPAP